MTIVTIHEQLALQIEQRKLIEASVVSAVARGKMTADYADRKLAIQDATIRTLDALRHVVIGKEFDHV